MPVNSQLDALARAVRTMLDESRRCQLSTATMADHAVLVASVSEVEQLLALYFLPPLPDAPFLVKGGAS